MLAMEAEDAAIRIAKVYFLSEKDQVRFALEVMSLYTWSSEPLAPEAEVDLSDPWARAYDDWIREVYGPALARPHPL